MIDGTPPHEDRAVDVQKVLLNDDAIVVVDVGVSEIDSHDAAVVRQIRAEQQRLPAVDQKLEMRQVARIEMKQPVRSARRRTDIAVAVDYQKAVAVLHRIAWAIRGAHRRDVEWRIGDLFGSPQIRGQAIS